MTHKHKITVLKQLYMHRNDDFHMNIANAVM